MVRATATLDQLRELEAVGWLSPAEHETLASTMRQLRQSRMLSTLLPSKPEAAVDTARAAGMVPVAVLWCFRDAAELTAHGAQHLLRTPAELLDLLAACGSD